VLIQQGTVISGLFSGSTASITKVLASTALLGCATPAGITAISGPIMASIAL
jgi:hypothetical protein